MQTFSCTVVTHAPQETAALAERLGAAAETGTVLCLVGDLGAGKTLFTQDLYLAVECGRSVPEGLEMGPFSYFPDAFDVEAETLHVMNADRLMKLIESAPSPVAAFSGYGFAVAAPRGDEVPYEDQMAFWEKLKEKYSRVDVVPFFGQNDTTLLVLKRNDGGSGGGDGEDGESDGNP